ncbi:MAG: MBL fold metallo-hydrolase [Thermoflexales bacterium]|nr:MBL fold metallo-hydrolase [Thermoflexales bacterium]
MVEVIFIGTGGSLPLPGRGNTAFVVRSAHSAVLVECGPTAPSGARNVGLELSQVPYMFISHCHGDHMLGFPMVMLERMISGKTLTPAPLHVFCPVSMVETLQKISLSVYPEVGETLRAITWHALPEGEISTVEMAPDLRLTAGPVGGPPRTPTLGVRLDFGEGIGVMYSSDTSPCEEVPNLAQGCDLLVHEAYFDTPPPRYYHSTGRSAGIAARQASCRMLALVHMGPSSYGREEVWVRDASESFPGQVIAPFDGDVVRLNRTEIQVIQGRSSVWLPSFPTYHHVTTP